MFHNSFTQLLQIDLNACNLHIVKVIKQKQFWDLFVTNHYIKNKNIAQNRHILSNCDEFCEL